MLSCRAQVSSSLHKATSESELFADPMSERAFSMLAAYSKSKLAQLCASFALHRSERRRAVGSAGAGHGSRPVAIIAVHPGNPSTAVACEVGSGAKPATRPRLRPAPLQPCSALTRGGARCRRGLGPDLLGARGWRSLAPAFTHRTIAPPSRAR